MAANTDPIYTNAPNIGGFSHADGNGGSAGPLKTANTAKDGTGTVLTVFTAGTNGSFIQKIRFRPAGTNVATVARIFVNNGSTNATIGNNIFVDDITLAATTNSEVAEQVMNEKTLNFAIPAGYKINVAIGTTVSAGWFVSVIGGDY
jgi:hypothetical protein